jgi:hypothetical protein
LVKSRSGHFENASVLIDVGVFFVYARDLSLTNAATFRKKSSATSEEKKSS